MSKSNVISLETQSAETIIEDSLTSFMREQAQRVLQVAVEQEVDHFIRQHADKQTTNGRQQVVLNGHLPERKIQTGIGEVVVKMPRVRDRGSDGAKVRFTSALIPKYMRRTVSLDVALPLLYLNGISSNNMNAALAPILGEAASNLSPNVISRLKSDWYADYEHWQKRDLSSKRYVYWWADGVYLKARMDNDKVCMLVIVAADEYGNKELLGFIDGYRESKDSWLELLRQLKKQGLSYAPHAAVGDGHLGFWGAISELFPTTKHQRCWVHKTANVLTKLPKKLHAKAKDELKDIYNAETKKDAKQAFDDMVANYELKYPKVAQCLTKDEQVLLTFFDFPAEHWIHLRTTNPIESTFGTVKHRTKRSKNCCARNTIIAATFKLMMEAQKRWKKLNGVKRLAQVIHLETFVDGIHQQQDLEQMNKAA